MASLQIRDIPEPLHQLLQRRARQHNRSLSQQALTDLQEACGGDASLRRLEALERISLLWSDRPAVAWPRSPEALIREDRER